MSCNKNYDRRIMKETVSSQFALRCAVTDYDDDSDDADDGVRANSGCITNI